MGETASRDKAPKESSIKGLKIGYSRIIWPGEETVGKQTVAALAAPIVFGLIIALINLIIKSGLSLVLQQGRGWFYIRS